MRDSIGMTTIGDENYWNGQAIENRLATYSPDGRRLIVVLQRGDLESFTNEFRALLWNTETLLQSPVPQILFSFASSSNYPGISDLAWRDDDTIVFLGSAANRFRQVYSYTLSSGKLTQLTNHSADVVAYSLAKDSNALAFLDDQPPVSIWSPEKRATGLVIDPQFPHELVLGQAPNPEGWSVYYIAPDGKQRTFKPSPATMRSGNLVALSPDGEKIIVRRKVPLIAPEWKEYKGTGSLSGYVGDILQKFAGQIASHSNVQQYIVCDVKTGIASVLLDAPLAVNARQVVWSSDGKTVVIDNTYIPLYGVSGAEREAARAATYTVTIDVNSHAYTKLRESTAKDAGGSFSWNNETNSLMESRSTSSNGLGHVVNTRFIRNGTGWTRTPDEVIQSDKPSLGLEEDINTPPRIFAFDPKNRSKTLLYDLNPCFGELWLGKVESISFLDSTGREIHAGLYYPPDFEKTRKYPLVIQTHGWNPLARRFSMDGFCRTGNAAQALAAKGMIVLQINDLDRTSLFTSDATRVALHAYEAAIDYLDGRSLIDPKRVGIVGFSRTVLYVEYALAFSTRRFAAAAIIEGEDGSYLQYLMSVGGRTAALWQSQLETYVGGGIPTGEGLKNWLENSPAFNVGRVQAPILIQALQPADILYHYGTFAALRRLDKPVEFMYIATAGEHNLVKAGDRLLSQGGCVDWFDFWLNGQEDADSGKGEQYRRWRRLRALYEHGLGVPRPPRLKWNATPVEDR